MHVLYIRDGCSRRDNTRWRSDKRAQQGPPAALRAPGPQVNLPFIISTDVSENPYLKIFKACTKPSSYKGNYDHKKI